MAEEFEQVRRNVVLFLSSLRRSIDLPFRGRSRVTDGERDRFMQMMMMVEEARIRFHTYTRYNQAPTSAEWEEACKELMQFVDRFAHSVDVDPKVYERRFIISPISSADRDNPFTQVFGNREIPTRVADALITFRSYIDSSRDILGDRQRVLSFDDLERIVPYQQVAPAQFTIVEGRIVVSSRVPRTAKADKANIQSALDYIRGSGEQLISNLENSNCDRRLVEGVKELQSQLVSDGNIVKIGLMNMACGVIGAQFHVELPDAIAGMLNAYNASISLYVAQFPEWEQFTNKAATIDLDENDVTRVDSAAGDVINELAKNPALADPEVPKSLTRIAAATP
jgi:hypothetical protein